MQQAAGAAQHFDAVVDKGVRVGALLAQGAAAHGRHAVIEKIGDLEAAGAEGEPFGVLGVDGDAGGPLHHLGDAVEVEVLHLLTGDHGHRLGRFPGREHHAGGGVAGAAGVAAGPFRDHAGVIAVHRSADHVDGVQLVGVIGIVVGGVQVGATGQDQTDGEAGKT